MSRKICGITVDDDFYSEYRKRKFKVLDENVNAIIVKEYATAEDIADKYPELAEAAKKVMADIQNEIREYYAAKDGRKEYKAMKHQNFGGYLEDLKKLFLEASRERETLKQKYEKARKTWEREESKNRGNDYERTRAKMAYLEEEKSYKDSIVELEKKYKEAANKVQTEFENHLADFYAPNGLRIDKPTVDLLNSGIKLKTSELDELLAQFYYNPTMLRVLGDYSTKNGLDKKSKALSYSHVAKGYGAEQKRLFNRVIEFVERVYGIEERYSLAWCNEKGRNDGIRMIDGAVAEMDGYFIRPKVVGE